MVTKGKLRETKPISQKIYIRKIGLYAVIRIKRNCKRMGGLIGASGKVIFLSGKQDMNRGN